MAEKPYFPWRRLWVADAAPNPSVGDAFLPDLASDASWAGHVFLEDLADVPLVVLLGGPGRGKTTAIDDEIARLEASGIPAERIDLSDLGAAHLLTDDLRRNHRIDAWRNGKQLHLFLDGLDRQLEDLTTIRKIVDREVLRERSRLPDLRLRIACRTADWIDAVATQFAERWPDGFREGSNEPMPQTFEIARLQHRDLVLAAAHFRVDAQEFLTQLGARGATGFASAPKTLIPLLDGFAEAGLLGSRVEVFEQSIARALDEPNPDPRPRFDGSSEPANLVPVAAQIAGLMLLTNRGGVTDEPDPIEGALTLAEIIDPGTASEERASAAVDRTSVVSVVKSGLMRLSSRRGLATFDHHTDAEFLCARWLTDGRLTDDMITALLVNPHDPSGEVLAHLREVAGWVGAFRPEVLSALVAAHPRVFLRGDLTAFDPSARAVIVEALLRESGESDVFAFRAPARDDLANLSYDGLPARLEAVLRDPEQPASRVELAVRIASRNELAELAPALVDSALNARLPAHIRAAAVRVVSELGAETDRARLLNLLKLEDANDPDDDLRGSALELLWPTMLAPDRLLDSLTQPKRRNYLGSYRLFLGRAADSYPRSDLAAALHWVARLEPEDEPLATALDDFANDLVRQAVSESVSPDVVDGFVELYGLRLRSEHWSLFRGHRDVESVRFGSTSTRRSILERLVEGAAFEGIHPRAIAFVTPRLIEAEDATWLLNRTVASSGETASRWASIVGASFWPEQFPTDQVLAAVQASLELREELQHWLTPVQLNSEIAATQRRRHAAASPIASASDPSRRTPAEPTPAQIARARELLDSSEAGNHYIWWEVDNLLRSGAAGHWTDSEVEPALWRQPGWKAASADTRVRMLRAGVRYLQFGDPTAHAWFLDNKGWRPAHAAVRMLVALRRFNPGSLSDLSDDALAQWIPAAIAFPFVRGDAPSARDVLSLFPERLTPAFAAWIERRVLADDKAGREPGLGTARTMLDRPPITDVLTRLALDSSLSFTTRRPLLLTLFNHGADVAEGAAAALVSALRRPSGRVPKRDRFVVEVGAALLQHAPQEAWRDVWPRLSRRKTIAEETVASVVERDVYAPITELSESHAVDFLLWIDKRWPRDRAPDIMDHAVVDGIHASLMFWRQRALELLVQRRTSEAVVAVRRYADANPAQPFLNVYVRQAEIAWADEQWEPLSPRQLLVLRDDPELRPVQSPEQLQAAVVASLRAANRALQVGWPQAWQLWNDGRTKGEGPTPKGEERLSDWLKSWLDRDLKQHAVTTREPQVRPTLQGTGIGARNDLRVDIPGDGDRSAIAVVIEVKRHMHAEVETAIRTQLADDYLRSAGLTHGIYLVGIYRAPGWKGPGSRRRSGRSIEDWQTRLDDLAAETTRQTGRSIKAIALDLSLRSDRASGRLRTQDRASDPHSV